MALQRLKEAAEKAKIELSSAQKTEINLPFITATPRAEAPPGGASDSRAKFEQMIEALVERTMGPDVKRRSRMPASEAETRSTR